MTLLFSDQVQHDSFLNGIIYWLNKNLIHFTPPKENTLLDIHPEMVGSDIHRKAFGELGLALRITERIPELRRRDDIQTLKSAWLEMAFENQIFFDATRRLKLFPLMVVSLSTLQSLDGDNKAYLEKTKKNLQKVMNRGFMDRIERSAWQKADLKYYMDASGLTHGFPEDAELLRQSSLLQPPSLFYATRMDLYGITHLIFHLSDFGAKKISPLTADELTLLKNYVKLAMQLCVFGQDYDLTAELLISALYLQEDDLAAQRDVLNIIVNAQQSEGFIPDTSWLAQKKSAEDPHFNEFQAVYHPTLVALILIASCSYRRYHS